MAYRELKVGNQIWRYIIGKKFTKIVDAEGNNHIRENSIIGNPAKGQKEHIVTPQNVKNAILGRPVPEFVCEEHGIRTNTLAPNPYVSEIEGKIAWMIDCDRCLADRAGDI